jgi:hypothetical protein
MGSGKGASPSPSHSNAILWEVARLVQRLSSRRIVTWMPYTLIFPACLEQRATGVRIRTLVHGMQLKHFKAATILGLAFKIASALAFNRSEATDRA